MWKFYTVSWLILALALAEVSSWTIDLPEVRKYFFEKAQAQKSKAIEGRERVFYDNIVPNSKHHEKHHENDPYAKEYGYQSYMEKKVNSIVYHGSVYLEGLRRSLLNYTKYLENCRRMEISLNSTSTNSSWQPAIESPITNFNISRCREATENSEHVRRLVELAMWSTRELQDIAYSRKYDKGHPYDMSQEENELILKLAWFLDRIAHYTGYEPEPKDFLHTSTTSTTAIPSPPGMFVNASQELVERLMRCIKEKSDVPVVERCRYPEPLPPALQQLIDANGNASTVPTVPQSQEPTAEPSQELLEMADTKLPPKLLSLMSPRSKRSLSMAKPEGTRMKREDPLSHFFNYYTKYKTWKASNINSEESRKYFEKFEVKNNLHYIRKREIDFKTHEDPYQDLSNYVKHKTGVNYIRDDDLRDKIRNTLRKMHEKGTATNKRLKRSLKYDKDVDLPRNSLNPQGDISYYAKIKPGRNYNNNIVQALQVRAGLEQIFNTGNIEVVRRYGANYNPLVPSPLMAGIFMTVADF